MKRGLITGQSGTAASYSKRGCEGRAALAEQDLPALLVYSDVWRSTEGRHLTNYMPYWNRSLIVILGSMLSPAMRAFAARLS